MMGGEGWSGAGSGGDVSMDRWIEGVEICVDVWRGAVGRTSTIVWCVKEG